MVVAFQVNCCIQNKKPSAVLDNIEYFKTTLSSAIMKQPLLRRMQQVPMHIDVSKIFKNASVKMLDAFVDSVFEFIDQPLLPSQKNFAPVGELQGEGAVITSIIGRIPDNFPEGVYVRNGQCSLNISLIKFISASTCISYCNLDCFSGKYNISFEVLLVPYTYDPVPTP
ncbi:uncharacterized protein LOC133738356 [Rosa rugosa]|uniref:uncharacterized protein LOC133738356 n=1 Tax=Rosa rugosa TaxID=74645 RepID=UPI002B40B310|nr:uncharacterized protein LOC133738356 [Rosa rugosa]